MEYQRDYLEVSPEMISFDRELLLWLNGFAGSYKALDNFILLIASDYLMPLVFSLSMFGLWFVGNGIVERRRYQMIVLLGISSIGLSNVAVYVVNVIWSRPRPFLEIEAINTMFYHATDPSFPANPVAVGFAASSAIWLANRKFGYWLMSLSLIYGFSRVYSGVFYPTDIIGGGLIGMAVTYFTIYLHRFLQPVSKLFIRAVQGLSIG